MSMIDNMATVSGWCMASVLAIAVICPPFIVPLVPMLLLYYRSMLYYRASARDTNRLQSVNTSPLITHFTETITGIVTIRGFGKVPAFLAENIMLTDHCHRPLFAREMVRRWMDLRLELINAGLQFFCCLSIVISSDILKLGWVDSTAAGLAMKQVLGTGAVLGFIVMIASMVEQSMNSVERMRYYISPDGVPVESARYSDPQQQKSSRLTWNDQAKDQPDPGQQPPPASWPSCGEVSFKSLSVTYERELKSQDDLVLSGISGTVRSCQRVGVVGRTGSGKSTLLTSLFRLVEAAEGSVEIDASELNGLPIAKLGLSELRQRLAIVPQDATLFSGTVSSNLDPLELNKKDQAGEGQLWEVLDAVQLSDAIKAKGGLSAEVEEGGSNFSMGERQLLCMARALLRKPRVLVLDEATASVDLETDRMIQRCIRERFAETTCLIIAHRISTVIDSDAIMVLDGGKLIEYDTPAALLRKPKGYFAAMCAEYGEVMMADLQNQAEMAESRATPALGAVVNVQEANERPAQERAQP